jgi:hypothetical protein
MKKLVILAALLLSLVPAARADHAPEWQMSTRKPETALAGIRVGKDSIAEARKVLGQSTRSKDLPDFPGEAEYVWDKGGTQIVLGTGFDPEKRSPRDEIVYSVKVSGTKVPARYATKAGVKLGDDLRALIRAYGPVYTTSWRPSKPGSQTFTFLFSDETELSASLSSQEGKIVELDLIASQE